MYVKCLFCGKDFRVYPYQIKKGFGKFCTRKHANKYNASSLSKNRIGKGNPMYQRKPWNYIDGKRTHYYTKGSWRRFAEKLRVHGKCKLCSKREDLIVHHIIPRKLGGTDQISNLMVLCRKCHNRLHAEMARGGDVYV